MDEHPHRPAGANDHRRADIEAALDETVAGPRAILLGRLTHGADKLALVVAGAEFSAHAEQRREHHAFDQLPAMRIDAIANPCVT